MILSMCIAEAYTVDFSSADDFLNYLRPSGDHWETRDGKLRWIFRGQRDASWSLVPTAWRTDLKTVEEISHLGALTDSLLGEGFWLNRRSFNVPEAIACALKQSEMELRMLQEFIAHANIAGTPFPNSSVNINAPDFGFIASASDMVEIFHEGFKHTKSAFFDAVLRSQRVDLRGQIPSPTEYDLAEIHRLLKCWPFAFNFTMRNSITALAQHHGIPTRLLDWSHDSRKAAFFSCQDIGEAVDLKSRIAVYGLNPFMLQHRFVSERDLADHTDNPEALALILSSHSTFIEKTQTTSYLAAQEGLFTYPKFADLYKILVGDYPTIDRCLELMAGWRDKNSEPSPPIGDYIRKVTLPYLEVDNLLDMLDDERIILSTMMPNLDKFKECMISRSKRKNRISQKKITP